MDSKNKIKWTLYISLASMFIFVSVSEVGPFSSMKKSAFSLFHPDPLQKYVVLFDGGSTGTRLHVFTFVNSESGGPLGLKSEYFEEVKPGLSNYADKPSNAAISVLHLLEKAKSLVPSDKWDETPVALKATAGLRLLSNTLSESILEAVSEAFHNSPFLCDDNNVSILDGEDEGLYAWYTLNFLLGRLTDPSHSVASLDLGGGSTQVTFTPTEIESFVHSPKEYIIVTKIQNKTMPIYTHSYLGFGLMAARLSILKLSSGKTAGSISGETAFRSSCIHPKVSSTWKHDLNNYLVMGREDEKYGYKECYQNAVEFLGSSVDRSEELQKREIYALSYYADRAVDLGVIDRRNGVITVGQFVNGCKKACRTKTKEMFLCLDCSYIAALLHHGLGFSEKKEIRIANRIDGINTSWGLGLAFNMLK